MLLLTSFSDWKQTRGIPAACIFLVGLTGWAILLSVPAHEPTGTDLHVRYFGCICVVVAGYVNIPIIICKSTLILRYVSSCHSLAVSQHWKSVSASYVTRYAQHHWSMSVIGCCFPVSDTIIMMFPTDVQFPLHREAPVQERMYCQCRFRQSGILYHDRHDLVLQNGEPTTRQGRRRST
jgi:hypothetical protein